MEPTTAAPINNLGSAFKSEKASIFGKTTPAPVSSQSKNVPHIPAKAAPKPSSQPVVAKIPSAADVNGLQKPVDPKTAVKPPVTDPAITPKPKAQDPAPIDPALGKTPEPDAPIDPDQKDWTDKTKNRFNELLGKKTTELEAKITERLRKEMGGEDYKGKYEELETKHKAAQQTLERVAVTESDAYHKAITEPYNGIKAQVERIAKENEVDAGALFTLLENADTKAKKETLSELLGNLTDVDRDDVNAMRRDLIKINADKKKIQDNPALAKKSMAEDRQRQIADFEKKSREDRLAATPNALESFKADIPELFEEGSSFDPTESHELVKSVMEKGVDRLLPGQQANVVAAAVYAKVAIPHLRGLIQSEKERADAAEAKLAEYDQANPEVSTSRSAAKVSPKTNYQDGLGKMFGRK